MRRFGTAVALAFVATASPSFATPPTAPATAVAPPANVTHVVYTARPAPALATGAYIMRFRLSTVGYQTASSDMIRAVPVVLGVKGNQIAIGGKYGPQVGGTLTNGSLSISGVTPGGASLVLSGTGGGSQGRFTISQGTTIIGGEYLIEPVSAGVLGETRAGVGTTSGFTNMTPSSVGWDSTGTYTLPTNLGNGTTAYGNGTTAPKSTQSSDFATNAAKVPGSGYVPGMSNNGLGGTGPNFAGTPISGWYSDDVSPTTPLTPGTTSGSTGGTTGNSDPSSKLKTYGDTSGSTGGTTSSSSSWGDSIKKWWAGLNWGSSSTNSGTSGQKTGKETNPMNDGSHDAGTAGSTLNFGHLPGAGGEHGGGTTNTGGVSAANGATLQKPIGAGDNPFEVSGADVLNASHLINGASDPGITKNLTH